MTHPGLNGAQTVVRRLRVASAGADTVTARLRAAGLLDGVSLSPAWLSPAAVVCVRRVRRPPPRARGRDCYGPPREWQRDLLADIDTQIRGAARPARGRVPADAGCVLFADGAELLACAAADWVGGQADGRWWWKSLLGAGAADARALLGLWRRHPEYVPGALEHLAAKGKAAGFARSLPAREARAVLTALTSTFALRDLDFVLAPDAPAQTSPGATFRDARSGARAGEGVGPPWRGLVPECEAASLDVVAESLLGVGLSLSRAPALARREDFARRAAAWARQAAQAVERAEPEAGRARAPRVQPAASTASGREDDEGGTRGRAGPMPSAPATGGEQRRRSSAARDGDAPRTLARSTDAAVKSERRRTGGIDDDEDADDGARALGGSGRVAKTDGGGEGDARPESAIDPGAEAGDPRVAGLGVMRGAAEASPADPSPGEGRVAPVLEAEIETRFGGLFHLVNLGLFLSLYGDFTTPAAPGLPLPVWDFVALLGRRLAGERVERDAVWPLLARLSGRDVGDEPGARFSPPEEWRAPADWLKPFGAACVLRWSEAGGRLRVAHPAGFTLIDVTLDVASDESPTSAHAASQLARELRPYLEAGARFQSRRVARLRGPRGRTSRARWLDRLSAYAVARLALALGTRGAARLSRMLCERHARVYVTAAHVDVSMRLAELPVEVRCAGLDRDPGWVPAAGRHVAFHFA